MKVQIIGKNIEVTKGLTEKIEKKLSLLNKYFASNEQIEARVLLRTYKAFGQKIEVTIPTTYGILRAEEINADMYAAIDLIIDKLERQIRKLKTRVNSKRHEGIKNTFTFEEVPPQEEEKLLVRNKEVKLEVMDLNEAITKMEMLDHTFFIYKDEETENVSVVYKRKSEGYGVIDVIE